MLLKAAFYANQTSKVHCGQQCKMISDIRMQSQTARVGGCGAGCVATGEARAGNNLLQSSRLASSCEGGRVSDGTRSKCAGLSADLLANWCQATCVACSRSAIACTRRRATCCCCQSRDTCHSTRLASARTTTQVGSLGVVHHLVVLQDRLLSIDACDAN